MGIRVIVDDHAPLSGQTVSGYGSRIPTRYRIVGTDGITRRVYAMTYGNASTLYIRRRGEVAVLSVEAEHAIETARDDA